MKETYIDDKYIIKEENKEYILYENENTLMYSIGKADSSSKAKRLILKSENSIITSLYYSIIKDDAEDNKIYDNQDNIKEYNTNSNSYVLDFENDENSYKVLIYYKLSSFNNRLSNASSNLSIISEENTYYFHISMPRISNRIIFKNSNIQSIKVDAGNQPTIIGRYYENPNKTYLCKYKIINQPTVYSLQNKNDFLSKHGKAFIITLICDINSEIIYTINSLPDTYTEENLKTSDELVIKKESLSNKVLFTISAKEEFLSKIKPNKGQINYYIFDDINKDDKPDEYYLISKVSTKHSLPIILEYTIYDSKYENILLYAQDDLSGQIFQYKTVQFITTNDFSTRLPAYVIVIIVIGSILLLIGIIILIWFYCKKNRMKINEEYVLSN